MAHYVAKSIIRNVVKPFVYYDDYNMREGYAYIRNEMTRMLKDDLSGDICIYQTEKYMGDNEKLIKVITVCNVTY